MAVVTKIFTYSYLKIYKMNETLTRALSGAIYVALLLFCTLFSTVSFHILFTIFMCLSILEFSKLTNYKYPYLFIGLGLLLSLTIFIIPSTPIQFTYISIGCCLFNLLLIANLFKNKSFSQYHKNYSHLFLYITLPFILILLLPNFINPAEHKIVISLFILIWCNDTFAYLVGKTWGKTKLLERVSPKKTIEGFLGGLLFTLLAGIIISYYFTFFSVTLWLITALLVASLGTIGDLVESKFKREAGIKDSGNIMPGHGGILDRLDSVIFVTPFIYLFYLIYFYYVS